jgi:hypothetical protein
MRETVLSRLERVSVRDVWPDEAQDFTPWLAKVENIQLLGETINLDLEVERTEANVGPFRADILCKNTADQSWVLIENQFGKTDPSHLGRLITYAAGLDAVTIIWIAETFAEEHRAALDWLNKTTGERISFLGIEVELWRIGDSPAAPRFNVVCRPNDWFDAVSTAAERIERGEVSETKQTYYEYWTALREELIRRRSALRPTNPMAESWYTFSIGRSGFQLEAVCSARDRRIRVNLKVDGPFFESRFGALEERAPELETAIGEKLEWRRYVKSGYVRLEQADADPMDRSRWPEQHGWFCSRLQRFYEVFSPIAKNWIDDEVPDSATHESEPAIDVTARSPLVPF